MPVGQRDFGRILDAHAFLQRCAHEGHAAECGACQPPDFRLRMPVDERHRTTVFEALVRGYQACDPGPYDHDVAVMLRHRQNPYLLSKVRLSKLDSYRMVALSGRTYNAEKHNGLLCARHTFSLLWR